MHCFLRFTFSFFFCIFICSKSNAQSTTQALNPGYTDKTLSTSNFLSSTLGEPFINILSNKTNVLTNGFLQPLGLYFLKATGDSLPCLSWKVWPVPANKFVGVYISKPKDCNANNLYLFVYDIIGRKIFERIQLEGSNLIDLSTVCNGTYLFVLYGGNKHISTQKVIVYH
jgi:hypothetical protein